MPSPSERAKPSPETLALALLAASSLQIMENLLPRIPLFPWMRIGFSYVILLPFLFQFGPRAAFALFLGRNCIGLVYGGQPLTTFLISSGSGLFAILGLGHPVDWAYRRGYLGILGASVLLATGFNLAQLALVNWALIRHVGFFFQTGPILAWSLLSGAGVALLIRFSENELGGLFTAPAPAGANGTDGAKTDARGAGSSEPDGRLPSSASGSAIPFLAGLIALAGLMALPDLRMQLPALALLIFAVPRRGTLLFQSWPFFFYLAWLHLFHTSGAYVLGDWITREGVQRFAEYAVRLANLILLGRWLSARFPWRRAERSRSPYLRGYLLALPLLSDLFKPSLELGREMIRGLMAGKRKGLLAPAFEAWQERMRDAARSAAERRGRPEAESGTGGLSGHEKAVAG
jgi:uncharacterized membrane protein